jgi:hypothetical protein
LLPGRCVLKCQNFASPHQILSIQIKEQYHQ